MKRFLILLVLTSSFTIYAQKNLQGKVVYMSKTTVDMSRWNRVKMSEQRKKQIMANMKNFLEKKYILSFAGTESEYKEDVKLETPGSSRGGFRMGGFGASGTQYKNTADTKVLESKEFFGKKFLISDKAKKPEWELSGETKKIGNYICYKATWKKKTNEFDWRSFRPRRRGNNDKKKDSTKTKNPTDNFERPKEVLITAWYTPQIPVSNGPGEYWGLPGLILEVSYNRTTILCTEVVLNPKEKIKIEEPVKGEKVTREEYNKIVKQKMEEMRERFRNRRRGSGRRRF